MKLSLERFINGAEETIGRLYIDGHFQCYTLEDQYRAVKVHGDTRIPAGSYEIKLRSFGEKNAQYASGHYGAAIKAMHHGMLWLQNVPGFDGVLIHIGNTDADTEGCILVGRTYTEASPGRYQIQNSTATYMLLYPMVCQALLRGESVTIDIK